MPSNDPCIHVILFCIPHVIRGNEPGCEATVVYLTAIKQDYIRLKLVFLYHILFTTECTRAKIPCLIVFKMFKSVLFILIGKLYSTKV